MRVNEALEFRVLNPDLETSLADFFAVVDASGTARQFHPHPFTADEARKICRYRGKDLYYAVVAGRCVLGYGMLRGWDEGYEVPSLGVAFRPEARGRGLGRAFMTFLHAAAKQAGARRIRLKVYPDNEPAVTLYRSLGYRFEGPSGEQLVGFFDL